MSDQNDSRYKERSWGRMMGMWERKNKKQTSSALSLSLSIPLFGRRISGLWECFGFLFLEISEARGLFPDPRRKNEYQKKIPFFWSDFMCLIIFIYFGLSPSKNR